MKKENRGGMRPGAGRKPCPEGKKIQISTRLHPEVVKILEESNIPKAQYIEMAIIKMKQEEDKTLLAFDQHLSKD